ncbi:hypothetical protein M441DRAFT_431181 [Trichoderma asperellum CBS 433.97]|uniref:Uncharacterized protein n=1 Tax=Trichoderma asperellum (strain ATCC 204424 / CBS 433.97 / NBRC 101777) TaxID=1042311 RepID=A0A2T3Z6E3_TRIA4|nr:hypothetical protein M441DRAFT_431181 [Trichoderma asperellum CBS 433.97]PTB40367.1 hypothetical protein M441DRAFT_431181 [Trichoderma asperellum CBS 433.97]
MLAINNRIDGDWSSPLNDTNSSACSDSTGSPRDLVVEDSNYAGGVNISDLQPAVPDDSSSFGEGSLPEIERQHRRHTRESPPVGRIVRCDRAINCSRALLEVLERMNPEVKIEVSVHITGTTEQGVQYPSSLIRIQRCDCMVCGVEQLHIAVPYQCKHKYSKKSAELKLGMDKTNNSTSGLSNSAVVIRTTDDRAL